MTLSIHELHSQFLYTEIVYYVNSTVEDFRASNDSRDLLSPVM